MRKIHSGRTDCNAIWKQSDCIWCRFNFPRNNVWFLQRHDLTCTHSHDHVVQHEVLVDVWRFDSQNCSSPPPFSSPLAKQWQVKPLGQSNILWPVTVSSMNSNPVKYMTKAKGKSRAVIQIQLWNVDTDWKGWNKIQTNALLTLLLGI